MVLGRLTVGLMVFGFRLAFALSVLFLFTMLQEPPKSEASDTSAFLTASLDNDTSALGDAVGQSSTDQANSSRETPGHAEEIEIAQWTTPRSRKLQKPLQQPFLRRVAA